MVLALALGKSLELLGATLASSGRVHGGTSTQQSLPRGAAGRRDPVSAQYAPPPSPGRLAACRSGSRAKTYVHVQAPPARPAGALAARCPFSIVCAEELSRALSALGLLRWQGHCRDEKGGVGPSPLARPGG